ncbi:hypothetical protein BT96DRAFT_932570 [Gymnopus androsaceus JB14]|uniref:Pectinesterase n=1 Tax=Gymnopus androsaceus JB14 TaxID=1447944 RepID=A0A6A4IIB9_9AGAR|nr:hypothetical protein BT96DRAFT_932570 [Gymnopus androsaceus JB14]
MAARSSYLITLLTVFVAYSLLLIASVDANPVLTAPKASLRKPLYRLRSLLSPDDGSAQMIFIEAGTYEEQIDIIRVGALTDEASTCVQSVLWKNCQSPHGNRQVGKKPED